MKPLFLLLMLAPFLGACQPLSLTGKIVNESGEPVPGATITVKRFSDNGQQPTVNVNHPSSITRHLSSDTAGRFSLSDLRIGDTILFTAVGYEPLAEVYEPDFSRSHQLTIVLTRKTALLQEVTINTGYQTLPRERATGSFAAVSNAALAQHTGLNILDRLDGVASATLFDHNANRPAITVRGLSTINGPKSPLIVVDNFPIEGDVNTINPADVESITILKDAAAASIWGARAGNGVIVITTKKARYNQPLKIEFGSTLTVQQPDDLSYLKTMSPSDFIDLESFLFSKGYYNSQEASTSRPVLSPAVEILIKQRSGGLSAADAELQLAALKQHDVKADYEKYIYRAGLTTQNYLSLTGGSSAMAWKVFSGFDKSRSQLSASLQRITLRTEASIRLAANLQLFTALSYAATTSVSGSSPYGSIFLNSTQRLYPYAALFDKAGAALPLYTYRQPYIDSAGGGRLLDWRLYPGDDYKNNRTTTKLASLIGQIGLSYKFGRGFKVEATWQYESQPTQTDNLHAGQSYFARDLINRFSQVNRATGTVAYTIPLGGILDKTAATITAQNLRSQVGFNNTFGLHQVVAIAGAELRQSASASSSFRAYGYNPDPLTTGAVDYVNTYPTFITGSKAAIPGSPSFTDKTYRFVSFYANAEYTYRARYSVSGSARKDASNLFGVATNDRWNPLWSAGAAWNLSKEGFYHWAGLPYLRLRATYGFSGNVDPAKSAVTIIRYSTASYTAYPSANFTQYNNPDLRWERSAMLNLGLDFRSSQSFLSGSIEYYFKRGTDLFGPAALDYTTGLNSRTVTKNVAAMKGSGLDLTLDAQWLSGKVKWNTAFLFSYSHSVITDYYLSSNLALNFVGAGSTVSGLPGSPVYAILAFKSAGLDAGGNPQGYVNNALSTDYNALTGSNVLVSDLVNAGSALPQYFGSISNSVSWKKFSASVLISYKLGYSFLKESVSYGQLFSQYFTNNDYARRWQKPGDEAVTFVPALVYPNNSNRDLFYTYSNTLVRSGDHIRLTTLNIAYTWPLRAASAFRNVQIGLNVSNLGILWQADKDGIDPDYGSAIPLSKAFSLSIKASL